MSRREIGLLRDFLREAIGFEGMLESWGIQARDYDILMEDADTQRIDGVRVGPGDATRSPLSAIAQQQVEDPTGALANMMSALKKGKGRFADAIKYLKVPPGEDRPDERTFRRRFYKAVGGAEKAMEIVRAIRKEAREAEGGEAEKKKSREKEEEERED